MKERLNILMVASELAPYVKTGGLGDMVAALSNQMKKEGHDVRIVLPFYGRIKYGNTPVETVFDSMCVAMGIGEVWCGLKMLKTEADVPVYLLDHEALFDRDGLYHDGNYNDYHDNPRRFGFFSESRAASGHRPEIFPRYCPCARLAGGLDSGISEDMV